ncbi:Male-specific lethal 1-like 1 [Trachymyrmex septentrionalis]|uniref:Male-specific lethal 1-like 1 n=1 Tax=Trachymyrmex septentrionalis TaxID=34720 RepID=A0A195FUC8_9HYME|nr:Male-specific lethal 1-like 1 [Trachymyrmex septentrionalis]
MSNQSSVSSLSERLVVNGEKSRSRSSVNAAGAATGAVSGNGGCRGVRGVGKGSCVGGGGGGGSIFDSYSGADSCVSHISAGSNKNNNNTTDIIGNGGVLVVTGGVIGGAADGLRDVTLSDAFRDTTPVNFCRETTVPRTCSGDCRCCTYAVDALLSSVTGATTCLANGGEDDDVAADDDVATSINYREITLSSAGTRTTTTPLLLDARSVDARTIDRSRSGNSNNSTNAAAVVIVDVAPSFHDVDDDEDNDDDDDDDNEEDEEDEEDEDRCRYHDRGKMVAAMNEHLSNATTTTTSSSPAVANAIRNTIAMSSSSSSSSSSSLSSSSSSSVSSAMMTATTTNAGGGGNPSATMMTISSVGSGANGNNNNAAGGGCTSARNQEFQEIDGDGKSTSGNTATAGIHSFPCDFDHMYASMTDGAAPAAAAATAATALGVSPLRGNEPRHNDLTEVKHLKELLLLHLDLIQQQSEQIVTKDKLLAALRQENETLKLRLERMERRVNLQKLRSECSENSTGSEHLGACSPTSVNSVNVPSTSELHRNVQCESTNNSNILHESFKIRLNTSGGITTVKQEPHDNQIKLEVKQEPNNEARFEWEEKKKRRSDPTPLSTGSKKKRGLSCSSTVSNDGVQEKILSQTLHETNRKSDRKSKSLVKKESFLTTEEHYYTAVGDPTYTLNMKQFSPVDTSNSLEVPNWRVKVYTSCYTMEGTENLDDEIFNKRHLKLENDERRRKRWDVQRIREQRHVEKLKQRQERQNHQATCYNTNHTGPCPSSMEEETITSLWPDIEQIQSIQVDLHLPVTAFGAPIPSFTPCEFSLPWSNITRIKCRRPKRSTSRRKSTGRRKV